MMKMPEYHWNIIEKLKEHNLDFHPQKCCHIQLTVTVSQFHKYVKKTLKSVLAVLKKCFFLKKIIAVSLKMFMQSFKCVTLIFTKITMIFYFSHFLRRKRGFKFDIASKHCAKQLGC